MGTAKPAWDIITPESLETDLANTVSSPPGGISIGCQQGAKPWSIFGKSREAGLAMIANLYS
jgi:hypothetical protein